MGYGIGASGVLGIAFEATPNTYIAPTKFIPLRSESLKYQQATVWRRIIKGNVDVNGPVPGNVHVTGDISIEATADVVAYFLYAARTTIIKAGTTPKTYNATGAHGATGTALRTLSITVVRNGIVFGYVGCVVSSFKFSIDNGLLVMDMSIVGSDEAVQTAPTPTWPTSLPFGAGMYNIQIPTATQVFDADGFTFEVNDNAEPQFRLKNTGRGAQWMKFGERDCTLATERDFQTRADYDAFKALTAQSITLKAIRDANNEIDFLMPVGSTEDYVIAGLSGQGDIIRSSVTYRGVYDATNNSPYKITVITNEDIT